MCATNCDQYVSFWYSCHSCGFVRNPSEEFCEQVILSLLRRQISPDYVSKACLALVTFLSDHQVCPVGSRIVSTLLASLNCL
jgi:hypothetical protein